MEGLEDLTGTRECRKDHKISAAVLRHQAGRHPLQTPKLKGKLPCISLRPPRARMTQESVPPSLGSCALRLSTTLFPKAATASTREKKKAEEVVGAGPSAAVQSAAAQPITHGWVRFSESPPDRPHCAPSSWCPSCRNRPGEPPRFAV